MKSTFGDPPWRIGDLAAQFGIATNVLRHWEHVGLLTPERDPAGRRLYGTRERSRAAVIIRGKQAGLGLDRLREILDAEPGRRRDLLEVHHGELEHRIEEIRAAKRMSNHALECEHADFTTCPNFQRLVDQTVDELGRGSLDPEIPGE